MTRFGDAWGGGMPSLTTKVRFGVVIFIVVLVGMVFVSNDKSSYNTAEQSHSFWTDEELMKIGGEELEATREARLTKEEKNLLVKNKKRTGWMFEESPESEQYCSKVRRLEKDYDEDADSGVFAAATERLEVVDDPWLLLVSQMMRPRYRSKKCTVPACPCAPRFVGIECNLMTASDRSAMPSLAEPAFALLGVQKGGTTAVTHNLREHPHIRHADKSHFFGGVSFQDAYRSMVVDPYELRAGPCLVVANYMRQEYARSKSSTSDFKAANGQLVYGVGDADLFFDGPVGTRMKYFHPHIKLVVMVRNPVTRTWSNMMMKVRKEGDTYDNVIHQLRKMVNVTRDALTRCDYVNNIESCLEKDVLKALDPLNPISKGLYELELAWWLRNFPGQENYVLLQSEMFYTREQECMDTLSDFIGVPRYQFPPRDFVKENVGGATAATVMPDDIEQLLQEFFQPYTLSFIEYLKRNNFTHAPVDASLWGLPWH